jgi:hypothetical protein
VSEFEKIVHVSPAFDKRDPNPSKNYGIGSCRITFILKGPKGAVQFMIGTDWYVPSAREHLRSFPKGPFDDQQKPMGWDVGYHSPRPMYEDQATMDNECHIIGGTCYYDGSSLRADEWVEPFVAGGTDWLWPELEKEYHRRFDDVAEAA